MKRFWRVLVFSLFLVSPAVVGCSTQQSQESAREMVEQEDAQFPEQEDQDEDEE